MASSTSAANTRTATLATLPSSVVTTAAVLTDETVPETSSYTATLPTKTMDTTISTANTAAVDTNNANSMTRIDTATAVSPANDVSSQPQQFTYTHEEVQELLEDAQLEGWQRGFEEGYGTGKKMGREEGKEDGYEAGYEEGSKKWAEGHDEGYEAGRKLGKEKEETACKIGRLVGMQDGKEEEQWKWLTEGHSAGLCLSMAAHACELFRGAVILEEAETQTNAVAMVNVNVQMTSAAHPIIEASTQAAPTTVRATLRSGPESPILARENQSY
jgi:hypothetical protein